MSDGYVLREDGGSIDVTAGALAQIVQRAAESVEGARVRRPRRGLDEPVLVAHRAASAGRRCSASAR